MDWLDTNSLKLTKRSLDNLWMSERYSMENIANIDMPNYKAKWVSFENQLGARLKAGKNATSRAKVVADVDDAIKNTKSLVLRDYSETAREDNNNVDLDSEFVEIARTQLQYQYSIRQISQEFQRLRTAIIGQ